jgi:hypothetical protein
MFPMVDGQNVALASYPRIDDHNMDGPFGEKMIIRWYQIRGLMNILRRYLVGDINN